MQREKLEEAAEFMQLFAEPARIHIVYLLHKRGELSVSKIQKETNYTQSLVSRHLRYLIEGEVLVVRSNNQERLYSINRQKDVLYLLIPLIELFWLKEENKKNTHVVLARMDLRPVNEDTKQKSLFE